MLNMKKWIIFILVCLMVVTFIRITWTHFLTTFDYVEKPLAKQGILDLRGWEFTNHQTLRLDGEWAFYPSQFLIEENVGETHDEKWTSSTAEPLFFQVPKRWDDAFTESEINSSQNENFHYGTYRLLILLDTDEEQTFALRVTNTSAIYANGDFIAQVGQPATNLAEHEARNIPYTATLAPEQGQIDLIIQASNHHRAGGLIQPVRFGTIEAIQLRTFISIGLQFLLCITIIIHGLYALILYFLGTKNKGLLYFSFIMICALFSVLIVDDKLLIIMFDLNYDWSMKIYYLTYIGAVAFIPPLFHHMFPNNLSKKLLFGFGAICSLFAFLVLTAYPLRSFPWGTTLSIIMFVSVSISTYILWKALRDKEDIVFL